MLQCNHKERSSYPLRCNMRSPCVIPSSRKIHRFFLRNFYPAACLCFCQVLKRLPYAVRSFLHFFSKQSFRNLFRFPCHIINHIRLYIKAIGNLYLRQRRTIQSYRFGQGGDLFRNALANLQDTPPKVPASAHRCGTHSPCRRPDTFRI